MYWTSLSNALKLTANSIYGATGFGLSNLYMKPIAFSITAYSRSTLRKVINYATQYDIEIVYSDTDSTF
ncbi:DNA-directed DNA polymerase [Gigaspora rosea]|uniref:DNA-directed DNA polymerase n=1 Tax=Gigaspora rosea TaxID=44941 RepID=A0A397V4N3_9GLOM|nr:DNA-directed DNA polymerase [Gigaspora rosea]